jgi:AcrR family transcriptional regulator
MVVRWSAASAHLYDPSRMTSYFERLEPRRSALYGRVAPLFAELGYREVTVRMAAKSCGLSASGLYHHFRSKRDLALFPILARTSLVVRCREILDASIDDPLVRLRIFIDEGLLGQAEFLLALRLADESGARPVVEPELRSIFRYATATYAAFARAAAPGLSPARGREFGEAALAIALARAVPGLSPDSVSVRAQLYALARGYLVAAGAEPERFDAAIAASASSEV